MYNTPRRLLLAASLSFEIEWYAYVLSLGYTLRAGACGVNPANAGCAPCIWTSRIKYGTSFCTALKFDEAAKTKNLT
ncbi:MAG: hypothetical protein CVU62_10980 [Deltaproteobacteria bacterium HGW-Deltaproteobacteria-2]|nr:MAG: hypothetical protein CVU62_10980 [Deltaproteobacteria bacterium HGW-Deltaproteobacteria-2]